MTRTLARRCFAAKNANFCLFDLKLKVSTVHNTYIHMYMFTMRWVYLVIAFHKTSSIQFITIVPVVIL